MSLFNILKRPNRQQEFWEWFVANQHRYTALKGDSDTDRLINEATKQLRKVDPRLCCEFSANATPPEIVISADGDKTAFSLVEELVANAPETPEWKIIAFRQRGGEICTISIGDIELGSAQIWFRLEGDGDKIGINLYFGGISLNDEVAGASFLLLDNALGEYDMETKVGFIERHQLKSEADVGHLKPFDQLPEAFDAFYTMTQK